MKNNDVTLFSTSYIDLVLVCDNVGVMREDIGDQLVRKFAISDSFVIKTKLVKH